MMSPSEWPGLPGPLEGQQSLQGRTGYRDIRVRCDRDRIYVPSSLDCHNACTAIQMLATVSHSRSGWLQKNGGPFRVETGPAGVAIRTIPGLLGRMAEADIVDVEHAGAALDRVGLAADADGQLLDRL